MNAHEVWLAAGVRTPFARVDGALERLDAVELSLPVVRAMTGSQSGVKPDLVVWGTVIPNLGYSNIARDSQDKIALASHHKALAGQKSGFFDDLIVPVEGMARDGFPRADTNLERLAKLQPAFDRKSGKGTITAGNASPLTDGAAGLWGATRAGGTRPPRSLPRARPVGLGGAAGADLHEGLSLAP